MKYYTPKGGYNLTLYWVPWYPQIKYYSGGKHGKLQHWRLKVGLSTGTLLEGNFAFEGIAILSDMSPSANVPDGSKYPKIHSQHDLVLTTSGILANALGA